MLQLFAFFPNVVYAQENFLAADANNDQKVDGIDYVIWVTNFGRLTSDDSLGGDFNRDGFVNGDDFDVWFNIYKESGLLTVTKTYQVAGYSTNNDLPLKAGGSSLKNLRLGILDSFGKYFGKIWSGPKIISFDQARKYAGKEKTVEGEIKEVINNGKAVYLGFKKPHNGEFVVRIMSGDWKNFPDFPDKVYREGQKIRVSGKIEWYQGDPVIYVKEPGQIEEL